MRTRPLLVALLAAAVALAGSDSPARERVRDLEGKLGAAYLDLWRETHADQDLLRAYDLGSKDADAAFEEELRATCRKEEWWRADPLLLAAAKRRPQDLARARGTALLRHSKKHAMHYVVSLPADWTPEKKWPVVLALEGAGCVWMNMLGPWMAARGELPYVIVTPLTTTNTNELDRSKYDYSDDEWNQIVAKGRMKFDLPGVLAVLDEVIADASGEEKVYLTCFSGGGILGWNVILGHPERLAAAAPACADFRGVADVSDWDGRGALPIKAFQGEDDPVRGMLDVEWRNARALAKRSGFTVTRELVPGTKHATCAARVVKFFEEIRTK